MKRVFVLGSMNMDTVLHVNHFVRPGETINAERVSHSLGGKGLNQAVAAARMGAPVTMLGCLGTDSASDFIRQELSHEAHLDLSHVQNVNGYNTSVAIIQIAANSDNAIVVSPGANRAVTPLRAEEWLADLTADDILVAQLEIPYDTVATALRLAHERGATTIFNPAPAAPCAELLSHVDILVLNEIEASEILGGGQADAARMLHEKHDLAVVVTLGAAGARVYSQGETHELPAMAVEALDTTGAGDAFVGALAASLSANHCLAEATRRGITLGGFACTQVGAQSYTQRRDDVERVLASRTHH
ncbi:MAG: ribokinase [Flaviflexus sp.]|nr:ribokinase [Flaviflexus sp.]